MLNAEENYNFLDILGVSVKKMIIFSSCVHIASFKMQILSIFNTYINTYFLFINIDELAKNWKRALWNTTKAFSIVNFFSFLLPSQSNFIFNFKIIAKNVPLNHQHNNLQQ